MHAILGFTESFNAHYFNCLFLIEKDAHKAYSEDDPQIILHGKELFEIHCNELQSDSQMLSVVFL